MGTTSILREIGRKRISMFRGDDALSQTLPQYRGRRPTTQGLRPMVPAGDLAPRGDRDEGLINRFEDADHLPLASLDLELRLSAASATEGDRHTDREQ